MSVIVANTTLLEEQDKMLFDNQRASQGNKTVTYTIKNSDGSDYLGIQGTTFETVTLNVYVSQEPKAVFNFEATLMPILEMQIDFFDDDNLVVGTVFTYEGIDYTAYSRYKHFTNRITVRGRGASA